MDEMLDVLKVKVEERTAAMGAPENLLPTWMAGEGTGRPHTERDGRAYCYVVQERGQEWARRRTQSEDEILWWIFEGVTPSMASDWEVAHRRPDEDSRLGSLQEAHRAARAARSSLGVPLSA